MRREFEMTEDQKSKIMDASQPTPCMKIGEYITRSPQENANFAWQSLGLELGFDHTTVQAVAGKPNQFFTAEIKGVPQPQIEPEPPCAFIDIVFDGPPAPESGRFIEVESPPGAGIKVGEWIERDDGYWVLRIPKPLVEVTDS